jgi:hypothetical protein
MKPLHGREMAVRKINGRKSKNALGRKSHGAAQ